MSVKALQAVGINQVELTEFPSPQVAADAILLENLYCGVCGTDLHGIQGKRTVEFPIIPGHELVSKVVEIGPKALETTKVFGGDDLKVGDIVTINPRILCGKCYYCKNLPAKPQLCMGARTYNSSIKSDKAPHLFGGWSEYMYILPNSEIVKLPEGIDLEVAALAEPLACSVGLLDRYQSSHQWITGDAFGINRDVVVFGAGAIGLLAVACFHLLGASSIMVIDAVPEKLSLAKEFGATITVDVTSTTADERIAMAKDAFDSLGPQIVVEACGVPQTLGEAVQMLRRGGKLFEMGHLLQAEPAAVSANLICRNELEIIGNYAYPSSHCLAYAARILMEAKLPYHKLLRCFAMDDYQEVLFGKPDNTDVVIKSVFKIN